jgi:hypothetical protein
MPFEHPLSVSTEHIFPIALVPFVYVNRTVAIPTPGDCLLVEGRGLHHCVIDLLNGQCRNISVVPQTPRAPLAWQANNIRRGKRLPKGVVKSTPYQSFVPAGWLLFETAMEWYCWPSTGLLAIASTRASLRFVFAHVTFEVSAKMSELEEVFEKWADVKYPPRHYSVRRSGYCGLMPDNRFGASAIRPHFCDPQQSLRGKSIIQRISYSTELPPPSRSKDLGHDI